MQLVMPALQQVTEEGQWQTAEGHMAARASVPVAHGTPPSSQVPGQEGVHGQGVGTGDHGPGFLDALLQNASEFAQRHRPPQ
jgi:hypothetical protein